MKFKVAFEIEGDCLDGEKYKLTKKNLGNTLMETLDVNGSDGSGNMRLTTDCWLTKIIIAKIK